MPRSVMVNYIPEPQSTTIIARMDMKLVSWHVYRLWYHDGSNLCLGKGIQSKALIDCTLIFH